MNEQRDYGDENDAPMRSDDFWNKVIQPGNDNVSEGLIEWRKLRMAEDWAENLTDFDSEYLKKMRIAPK